MNTNQSRFQEIGREIRRLRPIGKPLSDSPEVRKRLAELTEQCSDLGHVKGQYHDNGLGWCWWYCSVCGSAFDKIQHA